MTQGELAARIGVNQSTISFWEHGTEIPTVEHLIQLALTLPEIIESLEGRERVLLMRVLRLERDLFQGKCACSGCKCGSESSTASQVTADC
jgi:transcriptional regulator with XRE-family HTH domain